MSASKLYTADMLAAAMELAEFPPIANAPMHGTARSIACGSTLAIDMIMEAGRLTKFGLRVRSCAVGQAAAAVFARHAPQKSAADFIETQDALVRWLEGEGHRPNWPDLSLIEAARNFPARHGAILLPWNAAASALSTGSASG